MLLAIQGQLINLVISSEGKIKVKNIGNNI
jgi:hypothetical protein